METEKNTSNTSETPELDYIDVEILECSMTQRC